MHILLVSHVPLGGVRTYIDNLISGLLSISENIKVTLFVIGDQYSSFKEAGALKHPRLYYVYKEIEMSLEDEFDITSDCSIKRVEEEFVEFLNKKNIDLVDFQHLNGLGASLIEITQKRNIKTVVTMHDYWFICPNLFLYTRAFELCDGPAEGAKCLQCYPSEKSKLLMRHNYLHDQLLKNTNEIIVVSNSLKLKMLEEGIPEHKLNVVYPALAIEPKNKRKKSSNTLRIGYIGAISAHKGIHILLKAFEQLAHFDIELHLFGSANAYWRKKVKEQEQKYDNLYWYGAYKSNELSGLLESIDLVLIPSILPETGPLVVQEALRNSIPVIGARIGGIPEYINKEYGSLFIPGSAESLVTELRNVIKDPAIIEKWKANIPAFPSIDDFAKQIYELYKETIQRDNLKVKIDYSHLLMIEDREKIITNKLMMNYIVPKLITLLKRDSIKKIAIFGCGKYGKKMMGLVMKNNVEVVCFIDNNPQLNGRNYRDIPIYPLEKALQNYEDTIDMILIVADQEEEMIKQLQRTQTAINYLGLKSYYLLLSS